MKKIYYIISLFFACGLVGCSIADYVGTNYYVWVNNSDRSIMISNIGRFPENLNFKNQIIQPSESFSGIYGERGGGASSPHSHFSVMTIIFDDQIEVVYGTPYTMDEYRDPNVFYDQPFNPMWDENYEYKKLGRYEYQWTYTFTNADYEAAKRMAEAQEVREGE